MTELSDLASKYIHDRLVNGGHGTEWTFDQIEVIRKAVRDRFPDDRIVLTAYNSIEREFSKGHRCSVCGRTEAQNKAIGYDCVREC